jgi:hypothetical protein
MERTIAALAFAEDRHQRSRGDVRMFSDIAANYMA